MLEVRLFGQFDVRYNGAPVLIQSRTAQALLARMVMTPGVALRREALAGALWPETTESNARCNLRHALWRIRAALKRAGLESDILQADCISVAVDADVPLWVDAQEFAARCAARPETIEHMTQAVHLYSGGLLPGFYDDWSLAQRDRLQFAYDGLMTLLITRLRDEKRWAEMLQWSSAWANAGGGDEIPELALGAARLAMRQVLSLTAEERASHSVRYSVRRAVEQFTQFLKNESRPRPYGRTLTRLNWRHA